MSPITEADVPRNAEYFARLTVAPGHSAPTPEDHPGLLLCHRLDPPHEGEPQPVLAWWATKADFDRQRFPLTSLSGVTLEEEGYVRDAVRRKQSWWRRVGPYNLLVYTVTVVTGIISLHHFYAWVLQPPRLALEVPGAQTPGAAPFPLELTLRAVNRSTDVDARLEIDEVLLEPVGSDRAAGDTLLVTGAPAVVQIPAGRSADFTVLGDPVPSGRYAVAIRGTVRAGKLRREEWPAALSVRPEVRVWAERPVLEVTGIQPHDSQQVAELSGLLLAGSGGGERLRCAVVLVGAPELRVAAFAARGHGALSLQQVGTVTKLSWRVRDLSPFETRSVRILLSSPATVPWNQLFRSAGCSEEPRQGDAP